MCNRGFPHDDWVNKNDYTIFVSNGNANLANHIRGNSDSFEKSYDNITCEEDGDPSVTGNSESFVISHDSITCEECGDPNVILDNLRKNNFGRLTIGHLNINSLQNKFEALKSLL